MGQDQHDAPLGLGAGRPATGRQGGRAATGRRRPSWPPCATTASRRPACFDGPINGERFLAYVEQFLVPTLEPGDIVVLDNLGSHRGKAVRRAIRAAGARRLFLPKYSPDLNPIEQVFAKLKGAMRKAAGRPFDAIATEIASILDTYTPAECANYLRNAGYASI